MGAYNFFFLKEMIEINNTEAEIEKCNKSKVLVNSAKLAFIPASTTPTILQASTSPPNLDPNLFTFKPKLNPNTELLTRNLINFYERQQQHIRKQIDLVSVFIIMPKEFFTNYIKKKK